MKRFLILFIVISFVTVSYAGPNKIGWTKPDFRQDQFENDRKECIDSTDTNLVSEAFGKALEECLYEKGYKYYRFEMYPKEYEKKYEPTTVNTVLLKVGIISGVLAILILSAAVGGAGSALGGLGH
jgi:hypothetical protein